VESVACGLQGKDKGELVKRKSSFAIGSVHKKTDRRGGSEGSYWVEWTFFGRKAFSGKKSGGGKQKCKESLWLKVDRPGGTSRPNRREHGGEEPTAGLY